jgi:hypothetical protein
MARKGKAPDSIPDNRIRRSPGEWGMPPHKRKHDQSASVDKIKSTRYLVNIFTFSAALARLFV